MDEEVTKVVSFVSKLPDGSDAPLVLEAIAIRKAWPRVAAEDCERLFKGGSGTREEIGGARVCPSSLPLPLARGTPFPHTPDGSQPFGAGRYVVPDTSPPRLPRNALVLYLP